MRTKKIAMLLSLCMVLFVLAACSKDTQTSKDKVIKEGNIELTVSDDFEKQDATDTNYSWLYMGDEMLVMGVVEKQSDLANAGIEVDSVHSYAEVCAAASTYVKGDIQDKGGYSYCEYTALIDGNDFTYMAAFFQNGEDYYAITISCLSKDFDSLKSKMQGIIDSVKFN